MAHSVFRTALHIDWDETTGPKDERSIDGSAPSLKQVRLVAHLSQQLASASQMCAYRRDSPLSVRMRHGALRRQLLDLLPCFLWRICDSGGHAILGAVAVGRGDARPALEQGAPRIGEYRLSRNVTFSTIRQV